MQACTHESFRLQDDGFIAKILVKEGEKDISVGTPLLVMVEDEESVAAFSDYSPSGSAPAPSNKDASEESTAASDSSEPGEYLCPGSHAVQRHS